MSNIDGNINNKNRRAIKMMLWFGIASLFMTFAGFTSAFIVSKSREDWILNFVIFNDVECFIHVATEFPKNSNKPDVLINSGGVIGLTKDILKRSEMNIEEDLKLIGKRALQSMVYSKTNNMSVLDAMNSF